MSDTDLTDAEILERFEAFKIEITNRINKVIDDRLAAMTETYNAKTMEALNDGIEANANAVEELETRLRTLEGKYHPVSVGGRLFRIRGR